MGPLTVVEKPRGVGLDWGVASHAQAGQTECGDIWTIKEVSDGFVVAVIDGLGHGPNAALAARRAATAISCSATRSPDEILRACHVALSGSRGAAISIARIDPGEHDLTWLGVGNVEGLVLNPVSDKAASWRIESLVARGGVVGYDLPALRTTRIAFGVGAVLVFATDGIKQGFAREIRAGQHPQQTANQIMAAYERGNDDALVLVVKQMWDGRDHDS